MANITNTANFDYQFQGTEYNQNASSTISVPVEPVITMTKTVSNETPNVGDTITYFVTIILNDFTGAITNQVFSDIIPEGLEFVDGSLTIDTMPTAGNTDHIDVNWMPNSEHLIVYQCIVL